MSVNSWPLIWLSQWKNFDNESILDIHKIYDLNVQFGVNWDCIMNDGLQNKLANSLRLFTVHEVDEGQEEEF